MLKFSSLVPTVRLVVFEDIVLKAWRFCFSFRLLMLGFRFLNRCDFFKAVFELLVEHFLLRRVEVQDLNAVRVYQLSLLESLVDRSEGILGILSFRFLAAKKLADGEAKGAVENQLEHVLAENEVFISGCSAGINSRTALLYSSLRL